jgi:hypothetical protein
VKYYFVEIPRGDMKIPCCYQEGVVPLNEMADRGRMTVEQGIKTFVFAKTKCIVTAQRCFCAFRIGKGTVSISDCSIEWMDE